MSGTATKSVWFYDLTADGYSLDDKRTPIEANDIPDVLAKSLNRDEGPNSYRVPIENIRENNWSLAAGRYKPVTAEPVHHDTPGVSSPKCWPLKSASLPSSTACRLC